MIIERKANEIIFRLPATTKLKDLQDIANQFTYNDITKKSNTTQESVDELVKKIKKGRWNKTKKKLGL